MLELIMKPVPENVGEAVEAQIKKDFFYDWILYAVVLLQCGSLYVFLSNISDSSGFDLMGQIISLGILCGTFGINVGHELGHRKSVFEQFLAKILLLTSLYTHFFIEHNKGHHAHVATDQDPSSAVLGQSIYSFWPQTVFGTYSKAWKINLAELKNKNEGFFSLQNEMLLFTCAQLILIGVIGINFGLPTLFYFLISAMIGALLLETVNYIEHYGLLRKRNPSGNYERVLPKHSWNSNHLLGRLMLFELSRHSDHHYLASRKYQVLRHHDDAPQMPTGYPGMIILALFPPIWFRVMNRQIKKYESIISA
jgi:alkane 1-monooxygenase